MTRLQKLMAEKSKAIPVKLSRLDQLKLEKQTDAPKLIEGVKELRSDLGTLPTELNNLTDEELLAELGIDTEPYDPNAAFEAAQDVLFTPKEKTNEKVRTVDASSSPRTINGSRDYALRIRPKQIEREMQQSELQDAQSSADSQSEIRENTKSPQEEQSSTKSPSKKQTRLEKLQAKQREASSFTRGLGQRLRKDRIQEDEVTPVAVHYKERIQGKSRLAALLGEDKESERGSFKRIERQMNVDDSHLETSVKGNSHEKELFTRIKSKETELTVSPYKIIDYEQLDDSQKRAVDADHKYMIIDGPAGTGKSTVLSAKIQKIADSLESYPVAELRRNMDYVTSPIKSVAFICFTGKAVQNVRERVEEEFRQYNCMTAHKLLGYYPDEIEAYDEETHETKIVRRFIPSFNAENLLKFDVIVIDEAGMMPPKLINEIIIAAPHAKILFVGDGAQLPAIQGVAPFNVYRATIPTYTLTTVHRTSETDLVVNATRIRQGERPEFNGTNAFYKQISNRAQFAEGQVFSAISNLHKAGNFDPDLDTIIVTNNDYEMGQINLNEKMRTIFNKDAVPIRINAITHITRYAIGDKVMCKSNNDNDGLTNGMIGWVVDIRKNHKYVRPAAGAFVDASDFDLIYESAQDAEAVEPGQRECSHVVYVHFPTSYAENKVVGIHTQGGFSSLGLGYVTTCHKAQGSEYRNVVVVMHATGKRLVNREWFYTSWTRAKEKVYVLSDPNTMQRAQHKQALKGDTAEEKAQNYWKRFEDEIRLNTKRFQEDTMFTGNIKLYEPVSKQFNINKPIMLSQGEYDE